MKTKNILRIFCSLIFVWGAMTMKAQTMGENLLLNPGIELVSGSGSSIDLNSITDWNPVTSAWILANYSVSPVATPNAIRIGDNSFFTTNANGKALSAVRTGDYAVRLPGGQICGEYQVINVTEGKTYEFGCDFGLTTTGSQTVKGTEGIKIVSVNEDGTEGIVYTTLTIPAFAAGSSPFITHLKGSYTVPAGQNITQVSFHVDNVGPTGTTTNTNANAPVICFDQCFFRQVPPNLLSNPGFEYPDDGSQTSLPASWTSVPDEWFASYYGETPGTTITHAQTVPFVAPFTSNFNVRAPSSWFSSNSGMKPILTDNFTARIPSGTLDNLTATPPTYGAGTGGLYQVVTVTPGATYEYGCNIGFRDNNGNGNSEMNSDMAVKILGVDEDPEKDGLTTIGITYIRDFTPVVTGMSSSPTYGQYLYCNWYNNGIIGYVTIPAGVTQVRFQVDQRNHIGAGTKRSAVMVWDQCFFQLKPPTLTIGSSEKKTASDYINGGYGDIIIQSDGTSTGELDLQGHDLLVNGVVKFQQPFTEKKWYAVGFPFDVASVRCDKPVYDNYDLITYNPGGGSGEKGDYWLRTCNSTGTGFNDYESGSKTIAKGGYILQVPSALDGATFTFTSNSGVVLSNPGVIAPTTNGYQLTYNPSVANFPVNNDDASKIYFYAYGFNPNVSNNFGKITSEYDLKPFESAVVANNPDVVRSSLNIDGVTALPSVDLSSDKPVATEYYNLLGVKVLQPVKGNIYLVKTIFESGRTSVVKQFIRYN